MKGIKKITVDEYIRHREDMTFVVVGQNPTGGYEILLRLDGSYYDEGIAMDQAKYVSKVIGIPLAEGGL